MHGIAVELELEITRPGAFPDVGDTALALDLVIHADRVPDRHALQPLAACEKPRHVGIVEIARQPRIDAGDIAGHAVEEIDARRSAAAHPGSPCRFRPARKPPPAAECPRGRRPRSARRYRRHAGRTRFRNRNAPDRARARSAASAAVPSTVSSGDRCGRLSNHFGTRNSALAPIALPSPSTSISTRTKACGVALITTAPNRNGRAKVTGRSKKDMSRTAKRYGIEPAFNPARFG